MTKKYIVIKILFSLFSRSRPKASPTHNKRNATRKELLIQNNRSTKENNSEQHIT